MRMSMENGATARGGGRLSRLAVIGSGRLRLRTLMLIRWIAVAGQTATVLIVHFGLGFELPLLLCLSVIGALMLSNLILSQRDIGRVRLDDRTGALLLGFDVVQLALLLYLTGGLENAFSVLIIAPVLVSATTLSRGATVVLTLLAMVGISLLAFHHLPLPWSGEGLTLPVVYVLGIWTALAVATVFISAYVWSVAEEGRRMSEALAATQTSLLRQQRISALGGLVAAAAHELGSPLATIAVVAKELSREIPRDSPLAEDADLLLSQTERCREILAGLARTPEPSGAQPFAKLPLRQLIAAAAEPYQSEGVVLDIAAADGVIGDEPVLSCRSETLSGLGTLIQNAVQFARRAVRVDAYWNEDIMLIAIRDDGPGFPPAVLSAIGDPFISTRADDGEHMGLGIFIAQTLLERVGAELSFANRRGAEVVIRWPRTILGSQEAPDGA